MSKPPPDPPLPPEPSRRDDLPAGAERGTGAEAPPWRLFETSPLASLLLDAEGRILRVNLALRTLLGYSAPELAGRTLAQLTGPERAGEPLPPANGPGQSRSELCYRHRDGRKVYAITTLLRPEAGGGLALAQLIDVTREREAQRLLADGQRYAWSLFFQSPVAVALLDTEGRFVDVNPAYARLLGYEPGTLRGLSLLSMIIAEDRPAARARLAEVATTRVAQRYEEHYRHADGRVLRIEAHVAQVPGPRGEARLLAYVIDITEKHELLARLAAARERLELATLSANVSVWDLDGATMAYTWDEAGRRLYGLEPGAPDPDLAAWLQLLHPEDRPRLAGLVQERLQPGARSELELDFRILRPVDGAERWVHSAGRIVRDADGRALRALGVCWDVTDDVEARRALDAMSRFPEENPHPVLRYGADGALRYANPPARAILASIAEAGAETAAQWRERIAGATAAPVLHFELTLGERTFAFVTRLIAEHGYVNVYGNDITEQRRHEQRLSLQAAAMDSASNAMFITDPAGVIQWINRAFTSISGFDAEDAIGRTPRILKSGRQSPQWYEQMWAAILGGRVWRGHVVNRRKDGRLYDADQTITPMFDEHGAVAHYVAVHEDITQRLATEQKIIELAMIDPVTRLPNRNLFQRRLLEAMGRAQRTHRSMALMLMDLDHFKHINDSLGHAAGDELLRQVAGRVRALVRESDMIARLGGDEFALIYEDLERPEQAMEGAARIIETINKPFTLGEHQAHVSASIGITVFPGDQGGAEQLLKHADLAMYEAKAAGRARFQFFDHDMDARARQRFATESALHAALGTGELRLEFQPQLDLATGRVAAVEALVRWTHPLRGEIVPDEFVRLAEQSGLILSLNRWVLMRAIEQAGAWRRELPQPLQVAINLSAGQFEQPELPEQIETLLRQHGVPPEDIEIEITESAMMRHSAVVEANMRGLARLGVSISLDDFGTGYSSLLTIKSYPIGRLKIDRSFVADIGRDARDEQIIRATIGLARDLGLRVVAEGVETAAQATFLAREGCHLAQGFLFSRPLRPEAVAAWVRQAATGPRRF